MTKNPYFLSPAAENDVSEIIDYLSDENPIIAHEFLDVLYASMQNLADHPYMGHKRDDLTEKAVRFWPFKWHYLIIYKAETPVEIVRVLSGYRDIVSLL